MKYPITKILDFGASIYDRWTKHNLREIYKKLIELAELNGNEKVLDIGCGPGNLDLMIAEILGEGSIYGFRIEEEIKGPSFWKHHHTSYRVSVKRSFSPRFS